VNPSPTTIDVEALSVLYQPSLKSSAEQLNPLHRTQVPLIQQTHYKDQGLESVKCIKDFCIVEIPTGKTIVNLETTFNLAMPIKRARGNS
jgi:hypothetical protein